MKLPGIVLFLSLSPATLAMAGTTDNGSASGPVVREAQQLAFASHREWLRLLHFEKLNNFEASLIKSDEFFLAPDGRTSPASELSATIAAWSLPVGDDPDTHPRCLFPARYQWLARQLGAPENLAEIRCPRLERWARFAQLESLSLMMVSGYFGNPASTFGHILMKLNNGAARTPHSLLDMGINYGALIPENEPTLVYVYRGLTGGYDAGFSDQSFYRHDLTYSRTEFRDMWEYELALDDYQRRLIVNHLWEISGKKFTYYFLRENCAYRLAELLELATGEAFVTEVSLWYAPVNVFHRMRELDARKPGSLIRSVRFVPSSQRVLHAEFKQLNTGERARFNHIITGPPATLAARIAADNQAASPDLLGALLSYYDYRLAAFADEEQPIDLVQAKNEVLAYRLRLPPAPAAPAEIEPLMPPSSGSAPSRADIGYAWNEKYGSLLRLSYSAFNYDPVGNNNLAGSSLTAFDLNLLVDDDGKVYIDNLDFIRARKLNLHTIDIVGESQRSWEIGMGMRREDRACLRCNELFVDAALGYARRFGPGLTGFVLVNGALGSGDRNAEVAPAAGLLVGRQSPFRMELLADYSYSIDEQDGYWRGRVRSRYSFSPDFELRAAIAHDRRFEASLGVAVHW